MRRILNHLKERIINAAIIAVRPPATTEAVPHKSEPVSLTDISGKGDVLDLVKIRTRMAEIVVRQKALRRTARLPVSDTDDSVRHAKWDYAELSREMTALLCLRALSRSKLHISKIGGNRKGPRYGIYSDINPFTEADQEALVSAYLPDWYYYMK